MSERSRNKIINNIVATSISILAPVLIIPKLTQDMGISAYGIYMALMSEIALIQVFTELGLGMYLAKEVSINRNNTNELKLLLSSYFFIKLILFLIYLIFSLSLSAELTKVELLSYIILVLLVFDFSLFFSGLENYKLIAKIQLVSKFLLITLVFFNDFKEDGLIKILMINCSMYFFIFLVQCFFLNKHFGITKLTFSHVKIKAILKATLPYYSSKLLVNIYQQSSTFLVSKFLSSESVGIYSIALQLYKLGQVVIGAIAKVLYTSTVNTKDFKLIKKMSFLSLSVLFSFLPVVLLFGRDILYLIFDFDISILYSAVIPLYISLAFVIVSSYWGYPALTAIGKEKFAHLGILVSSLTYFSLFFLSYVLTDFNLFIFIYLIVISDLLGMLYRIFYARKFKLL